MLTTFCPALMQMFKKTQNINIPDQCAKNVTGDLLTEKQDQTWTDKLPKTLPKLRTERLSSGLTMTPVPRSLNAPCALIFTAQAKAADHKKVNKQVQKEISPMGLQTSVFLPSFTSASTPVKSGTVPSVSPSACMPPSTAAPAQVDTATSPLSNQYRGLRPIHQLSTPLSREEELYLTQLVRIKMKESADKMTVHCKTRGQPLVLVKIIKPRK